MSFFKRLFGSSEKKALDEGLQPTKKNVLTQLARVFTGRRKLDDDLMEELEEALITADVGVETTMRIIDRLRKRARWEAYLENQELYEMLREVLLDLFTDLDADGQAQPAPSGWEGFHPTGQKPFVVMVVGVNGVGKTTTIGKLAHRFKQEGASVLLSAADTFRAAAIDQLQVWAQRVDVPIIAQKMGSDPASVAFDSLHAAVARGSDVVIVDTAGRLHNKRGLMEELTKIKRVMDKVVPGAPHEVLLVLDGSTGQNAIEQAKQFLEATEVTGLVITKLDGTAKGGVVLAIRNQLHIPVRFIGVGEKLGDLQDFDARAFIESLLPEKMETPRPEA
ncbi:MAG: signal recognition particle-docking protein FtsY [Bacteroidota bacterium]|jgi:fused signal recognition particle receptor